MTGCASGVEVWRPTPQAGHYEVSTHGRVRNARTGRVLAPWRSDRGYRYVTLYPQPRRPVAASVHVLVMTVHGTPRPAGHDVDHVDWDRDHNCVRNLRWLPSDLNSTRWWSGRTSDRRNIWATKDDPAPCDHVPLTVEQEAALLADLSAAGWAS